MRHLLSVTLLGGRAGLQMRTVWLQPEALKALCCAAGLLIVCGVRVLARWLNGSLYLI